MPAIVRGGRRQAPESPQSTSKAARAKAAHAAATHVNANTRPATSGRKAAGSRRRDDPVKTSLMGSVPLPNELLAWLAVLLVGGVIAAALMTGGRAEAVRTAIINFADQRIAAFGINLQKVRLVGASPAAQKDIKKAMMGLDLYPGKPLALMDLGRIKTEVEKVGWVKSATVRRQLPDGLIVDVIERPRIAIWQYQQKNYVIDDEGQIIPEAQAPDFVDLPMVVGEGANEKAAGLIKILHSHPQISSRLWAMVRVDTRRWDLRFRNDTIVKLPALDEETALDTLDNLIVQKRILDQGLAVIDLRNPEAMVVIPFTPKT